jgi:hypothetical protein
MLRLGLLATVLVLSSCGGAQSPLPPPTAPTYDDEASCKVMRSHAEPLVVEWPIADRAKLETAKDKGRVAVKYDGCVMRLLPTCKVPGSYVYKPVTRKHDNVRITNQDELYANLPAGAATLRGRLEHGGQLGIQMTIVGRLESDGATPTAADLGPDCASATHVISALTLGAFEFASFARTSAGAGVQVMSAGAGGSASATKETLSSDGVEIACEQAKHSDTKPPDDCAALIRVEVLEIPKGEGDAARAQLDAVSAEIAHRNEEIASLRDITTSMRRGLHDKASCLSADQAARFSSEIDANEADLARGRESVGRLEAERTAAVGGDKTLRREDLEARVAELKDQIRRTHTRLALLSDTIFNVRCETNPLEVTTTIDSAKSFVTTQVVVVVDGQTLYSRAGDFGSVSAIPIFSGKISGGEHTLAAQLRLVTRAQPPRVFEANTSLRFDANDTVGLDVAASEIGRLTPSLRVTRRRPGGGVVTESPAVRVTEPAH